MCDRRPDPEAQRLFSYNMADGLHIEREWGHLESQSAQHALHPRFAAHVQQGQRAARSLNSKLWMLCFTKRVSVETVNEDLGVPPVW